MLPSSQICSPRRHSTPTAMRRSIRSLRARSPITSETCSAARFNVAVIAHVVFPPSGGHEAPWTVRSLSARALAASRLPATSRARRAQTSPQVSARSYFTFTHRSKRAFTTHLRGPSHSHVPRYRGVHTMAPPWPVATVAWVCMAVSGSLSRSELFRDATMARGCLLDCPWTRFPGIPSKLSSFGRGNTDTVTRSIAESPRRARLSWRWYTAQQSVDYRAANPPSGVKSPVAEGPALLSLTLAAALP